MTEAERALGRIEAILSDLEALEAETRGIYRQPSDGEALAIATRIESKMAQQHKEHAR